jgi:integrase
LIETEIESAKLIELIKGFSRELEYQGLSIASRKRYLEVIRGFLCFCNKSSFNEEDAKRYLEFKMKKCKAGAIRFYYQVLTNFFRFLIPGFNRFSFNPPNLPREVYRPLFSEEEIFKMLELAKEESERDYLLLRLFYASGARRKEIASAELDDVFIEGNYAYFRVKHGKTGPRVIPIDLETASGILNWRAKQAIGKSLFGLSEIRINMIIKHYREKAGINKARAGGHAFRRSYASHLRARGMDVLDIKDALGHKSIQMTQIYSQLTPVGLARKLRGKHPLAREKEV